MEKKKICFIVAVPGSAEAFLRDHIAALQTKYEVHLVANFPEGYDGSMFFKNVVYHQIAILRAINIFKDLRAIYSLYKLFRKERFECIHSVTPKAGMVSAIAGWLAGIPRRIHIFTGQVWCTRKGIMRFILKTIDRIIAMLDTHLLVDGEGQRQFLIQEGVLRPQNSQVLASGSIAGVKLDRFIISPEIRRKERERFGLKDDDICYIFLGRLNHDKGIGELFQAFDQLASECPKSKLLLYGVDEEGYDPQADTYSHIKRGENYFYPGRTSQPFNALQAGDVFVLPTWREGFGMSVIEAQGLALPVITSDAYGVVDASVAGETGLRCKVGDPNSLYGVMKEYYDHPELIKKHGEAGRKRVIEKFDNTIVSQAWLDFYDEIL